VTEPAPEQKRADAAPLAAECRMLHTIRGGVLPSGKIIGRNGSLIMLADEAGLIYRVPFFLFADPVKTSVRNEITRREGQEFIPVDDESGGGRRPKRAATKGRSPKTAEAPAAGTGGNTDAARPRPIGDTRLWSLRGGGTTWNGAFCELDPPFVSILTPDGKIEQLALPLLDESDQQYAEALARDGKPGAPPRGAFVFKARDPRIITGADGKPLYILDGRTLHTLSRDGLPAGGKHLLGADYLALRERADYWVAATGKALHMLDKKTLRPRASFELSKYRRIRDLALLPSRPVAVLSVEEAPENTTRSHRIVLVEEQDGTVHEPMRAFGTWVRVDPSGEFLVAGQHVSLGGGPDEEIDADGNVIPRRNDEDVDTLRRFRIDGFGVILDEEFDHAGSNGQALVASPDGQRVSYLSRTGSPSLSYDIQALDARDFRREPVTFSTKDKADCMRLVYSPRGDLAASPTRGGAVVFDAHTGAELPGRISPDPDLSGAVIHDLAFSGDGAHLILIASRGGSSRYFKRIPVSSP
jgi:hypothetical protein